MPADSVRLLCPVASQGEVAEYKSRYMTVPLAEGSVVVWASRGVIDWIDVTSPQFRTSDSLGVGTSLQRLMDLPVWEAGVGDGEDMLLLYTQSGDACGFTFRLDAETALKLARTSDLRGALQRLARSGRVIAVWVRGRARCR